MTKYIASCSFGKDSLATIILALKNNEPLDEVIYCEVMFDKEISGEIPEHRDFIHNIAIPRLKMHGIKTTILRHDIHTYLSRFNNIIKKGKRIGKLWSFPLCGKCWVNRDCKMPPINAWKNSLSNNVVQYLGIAKDEQERLLRLDGITKISLLEKYNITESMAFDICRKENLLSPMYEFTNRGGCWFCPNAKEKELRHLYDYHPDLWGKMLELQALPNKATDKFNRTQTFYDIDFKFKAQDAQISLF